MWLCDLNSAINDLYELCPDYVFEKVEPRGSGIMFYTTHFTIVLWCSDGQIIEYYDNGEIKTLKENFEKGLTN